MKVKKLITKSITNTIDNEESIKLEQWLKKTKNKDLFKVYLRDLYSLNMFYEDGDEEKVFQKILSDIEEIKSKKRHFTQHWIKYAAAASVLLLVSIKIFNNKKSYNQPIIVNNNIKTGTDKATLTLSDGSNVVLEKGQIYTTNTVASNGEKLVYNSKTVTKEIIYNTLTIPRGGQYQLTLTDGTMIWLNSATQLKYPVVFVEGETRQVELIYGEAYFDVSSSTEHKGAKFKVFHNAQEVEVLGTEFNIKAYKDETNIYTTLAEGKVKVLTEQRYKVLSPGEQSNLDMVTNSMSVSVVNLQFELGWKEGLYSFKGKSLKEIMQVLSRWYDMDVIFADKALEEARFIGTLGRGQHITDILNSIKTFGIIKNYEINDKTIIIK